MISHVRTAAVSLLFTNLFYFFDMLGERTMSLFTIRIIKNVKQHITKRLISGGDGLMHKPGRDISTAALTYIKFLIAQLYFPHTGCDIKDLVFVTVLMRRTIQFGTPFIQANLSQLCFASIDQNNNFIQSSHIQFLAFRKVLMKHLFFSFNNNVIN